MIITDDTEYNYDKSTIHDLSPEEQREEMLKWFESRYEDPVHSCPRENGDFVYVFGGPHSAIEELTSEFENLVPREVIEDLASELDSLCDWAAKEPPKDWFDNYDIDYINDIITDKNSYINFHKSIDNIDSLLNLDCSNAPQNTLYKILYANVITSLESYLSESFIINVFESNEALENFLKHNKHLKNEKYTLIQILQKEDLIEQAVKKFLATILWHDIPKIKSFYKFTFNITFGDNLEFICKAVNNRHDIIHRNGKSTEGEELNISKDDVQELTLNVKELVEHIETQIKEYREKDVSF